MALAAPASYVVLLLNPLCRTILQELIRGVLSPIVCSQNMDLPSCLVLNKSLELSKPLKDL